MRGRKLGLLAALVAGITAVAVPGAIGAVTIAITSPVNGATISAGAPALEVAGTANFDAPVATRRTFLLHFADCGGTSHAWLSTKSNADQDGCGYVAQPANEALHAAGEALAWTYMAEDGVPFLLDSGSLLGTITTAGYPLPPAQAGQVSTDIVITADTDDGGVTLVNQTYEYTVTPQSSTYGIPLDVAVPASAVGLEVTGLTIDVTIRGLQVGHGTVAVNGKSSFSLPILDRGVVEVSTSPTFKADSTVQAMQTGGTWFAELPVPAAGARKIYARAVQGTTKQSATPVSITVTG